MRVSGLVVPGNSLESWIRNDDSFFCIGKSRSSHRVYCVFVYVEYLLRYTVNLQDNTENSVLVCETEICLSVSVQP